MKGNNKLLILLSILFFSIGLIGFIFINSISEYIFDFIRLNFSPDKDIQGGIKAFRTNLFFVDVCLWGLAAFMISLTYSAVRTFFIDFFYNDSIKNYLFRDKYVPGSFPKITFFITAFGNLFIYLIFKFRKVPSMQFLFGEDNLFEWLTAIFFLISSIALVIGVLQIYGNKTFQFQNKKLFLLGLLFFGLLNFWVFGEEISWGQRIFNWQTSESFEMNFQNETNMHNFFNPIINSVFSIVTFLLSVILLIGWIRDRDKTTTLFQIVFPHSSMFPAAVFILFTSSIQGEMSELILSLFIVFYSIRIFLIPKYLSKN